nr:ATP-binding protein [Natroniella acetigena]
MLNLTSNAIKFTDKGENIYIAVKDTEIGIPKEKQEKIFKQFEQVDTSLTRNVKGTGIGLSSQTILFL